MKKSFSGQKPAAVVSPLDDHMGLDIARILTSRGIKVYGVDHNRNIPGRFSNSCEYVYCPFSEKEEDKYIRFLEEFGNTFTKKAVLYPLSDEHVYLFSKYRDKLNKYYSFVLPEHALIERLITKDGLYSIVCKHSIPAPRTFFVCDEKTFCSVSKEVVYPAIIKPEESAFWHSEKAGRLLRKGLFAGRPKVVYCRDQQELRVAFNQIALIDPRIVIQEVIPGDDKNLIYTAFYCDSSSELLGYFSGRKYRVIPKGFGSASYVKSYDDPELKKVVIKFLRDINYQGLGGIEFKKDSRDGIYKIIEFNPRFGMWDGMSAYCGVNLPEIAYRDALGLEVEKRLSFQNGIIWVDWQRDIRAFFEYRSAGKLTFRQWSKSLLGEKIVAIYSYSDWKPGVFFTFSLLWKFGQRIRTEIIRTLNLLFEKRI